MPQALLVGPKPAGGSTATTMRCSSGAARNPRILDEVALENRLGIILDQFAVQFLPPQPCSAIAFRHLVKK